jgi:hypothetical protein
MTIKHYFQDNVNPEVVISGKRNCWGEERIVQRKKERDVFEKAAEGFSGKKGIPWILSVLEADPKLVAVADALGYPLCSF